MSVDQPQEVKEFPTRIYPSKRDLWIVAILWAIILFSLASIVYIFYTVTSIASIIAQESFFLIIVAFCLSILRNTYYVLEGDHLLVRSGWFRWRIKLADIEEVAPTRKLWSSAALSVDRLYVRHGSSRAGTYISPEDKDGFMRDLAARSPDLVLAEEKVVRWQQP